MSLRGPVDSLVFQETPDIDVFPATYFVDPDERPFLQLREKGFHLHVVSRKNHRLHLHRVRLDVAVVVGEVPEADE